MILSTKDLRAFKQASSFIKQNKVLPILDYIKFEAGMVTKTNLNAFITYPIPNADPMLVKELTLWKALENAGDTINIEQRGNRILISSGKIKNECPTEDAVTYPVIAASIGPAFDITHILSELFIAAGQTSQEALETNFSFVHVGKKHIIGTDRFVAYAQKVQDDIPEMVLRREEIYPIAGHHNVMFNENDNWHFFTAGDIKYGFNKTDNRFFDMTSALTIPQGLPSIKINKGLIESFNSMCIGLTPAEHFFCTMTTDNGVHLNFNDADYSENAETDIEAVVDGDHPPFHYNCALMNKLLKQLPDEEITIYNGGTKLYITGEGGYNALVMGYVKQ